MKADKSSTSRLIKTAKGQLDGILKMIDDDKYCIDISNQIMASIAILKKANTMVLTAHIEGCVKEAIDTGEVEQKVNELTQIVEKLSK
jgi:DNA-binding FrmR family transcriptional regulator